MVFPTIHISCPCNDSISIAPKAPKHKHKKSRSRDEPEEEEEETFDPRSPRSNFSLFPLENLLYCGDCNQIRCPRCVHDEIVCYFCPSCLFEVPSSAIKSDGNRCTRNCFSCSICNSSLIVASTRDDQPGPYVLLCPHCHWSSSEIGIEFEKPTSITTQLAAKLKTASTPSITPAIQPSTTSDSYFPSISISPTPAINLPPTDTAPRAPELYTRLKTHYTAQRASATDEFGTSTALSRLIGLYSATSLTVKPRSFSGSSGVGKPLLGRDRRTEWTELEHPLELGSEDAEIARLREVGYAGTTSTRQRLMQSTMANNALFVEDLRPMAVLLRTKRSKRCRACKHILVKAESKVTAMRFRYKLVAVNYIPALTVSWLDPTAVNYDSLTPLNTHQFLLTVTNPLFDTVHITLATPARTPGRFGTTVTILCPDFEVGANTDVWEEALGTADAPKNTKKGKKTGNMGTIWDADRNWTTVVIEIIPPLLPSEYGPGKDTPTEDDYLVQVPVSVRVEYETDVEREDSLGKEVKERREHTYWCVLGLGRIGKFGTPATPAATPLGTGTGPVDVLGALGSSGAGLGRSAGFSAKVGSSPPIVAGMVGMGVAGGLGKRNLK